jgi:undecaprenyl-phosphate galactose phosphotransferase
MEEKNAGVEIMKWRHCCGANGVSEKNRLYLYKHCLFIHDLAIAIGSFMIGALLIGFNFKENLNQAIGLLIISLVSISFFMSYHLYNYHIIYAAKNHVKNMLKAFIWGVAVYLLIALLYTLPDLFNGPYVIFLTVSVSIVVILLDRILTDNQLNIIKAVGISFIVVGLLGLVISEEKPQVISNWGAVPIGFAIVVSVSLVSRYFLVHQVFSNWMRKSFRRQVVIIGSDQQAGDIASHIIKTNAPFWISGVIGKASAPTFNLPVSKKSLGDVYNLQNIVENNKIQEIIFTDETISKQMLISILEYSIFKGLNVWFPPNYMPILSVKLYNDNFCGISMLRLCTQKNKWLFDKLKHAFDALTTLPIFILQLPFFLLIAMAIKLDSKGPVFYKATVVGKNEKTFSMYKFRSMEINNDAQIHRQYVSRLIKGEIGPEQGEEQPLKITEDPRITRVGKVLRKFSLDELPQLINVIKGDMSLVGPRPCLPYEFELYKDWYKKRTVVRPGISGLWQVTGRSEVSFEDMILLDLYYVFNRNIILDMNILFETFFVVLSKKGAY